MATSYPSSAVLTELASYNACRRRAYQKRTPRLLLYVVDIDVCLPRTHFLCPKCQFIWTLPYRHLWATFWYFRTSYSEFSDSLTQVSNLMGTLVINLYEIPPPFCEALPAPITEVRYDVLYEAVSIFLLLRQQLQRINQMPTKASRYCMRFEDLGLVNTFACLHHHEPDWLLPPKL